MTNSAPDQFPMQDGLRLRGLAMTRVETFADAAFAFAVTLLVISVDDVPRSFDEMVNALKSIPVFLFASAQVFVFWFAHRNWSRVYGLDDRVAVFLTLLLVASLLVMVFPLRIVYAFGASDLTDYWIPGPFLLDSERWTEQIRLIFIMLGVSWAWLAGVVVALFAYALTQARQLALNDTEINNARGYILAFSIVGGSGILSIVLAATVPGGWIRLAGYQYSLLFLLPLVIYFRKHRRARPAN